jgi:hypothetical protein
MLEPTCRPCAPSPAPIPAEIATLQVAAVVIATVVCTTLLIGADVDTGSTQGLQAFVDSLAANAAAGADAAQASRAAVSRTVRVQGLWGTCSRLMQQRGGGKPQCIPLGASH